MSVLAAFAMLGGGASQSAPTDIAASAPAFDPYAGAAPLAVMVEVEPHLLVAGSDMPRIAVYDGGEVVFAQRAGNGLSYRRTLLDPAGLAELRARVRRVLREAALRPTYETNDAGADARETRIFLRDGQRSFAVSLREKTAPMAVSSPRSMQSSVPAALRELRGWLRDFDVASATAWQAKYIEVMFWPNPEATDESIAWPPEWPSLSSPRAIARGAMVSVYLDGRMLPPLREFLATQEPRGAIAIGGRKMAVDFRLAFPSEPVWRKAFATLPARPSAGSEAQ